MDLKYELAVSTYSAKDSLRLDVSPDAVIKRCTDSHLGGLGRTILPQVTLPLVPLVPPASGFDPITPPSAAVCLPTSQRNADQL